METFFEWVEQTYGYIGLTILFVSIILSIAFFVFVIVSLTLSYGAQWLLIFTTPIIYFYYKYCLANRNKSETVNDTE
jgi:uncharacterized membrane protein YoaK (UPF0700 family)